MPTYAVRPLDRTDEAVNRRAFDVAVAADSYERPHYSPPAYSEWLLEYTDHSPLERLDPLGAFVGDELVGFAGFWLPQRTNTHQAWQWVCVEPQRRGQGIGTALVAALVGRAHALGRTELLAEVWAPSDQPEHPYRRFAERRGFAIANVEVARALALPVEGPLLARLEAASRPRWEADYDVLTVTGGLPEDLQPSYCDLANLVAVDAPTGEADFEADALDPAEYTRYVALQAAQGRTRLSAVAVPKGSRQVVAFTDLIVPVGDPTRVHQWDTYVSRDHRGHGLGLAVKLANLRALARCHPSARRRPRRPGSPARDTVGRCCSPSPSPR